MSQPFVERALAPGCALALALAGCGRPPEPLPDVVDAPVASDAADVLSLPDSPRDALSDAPPTGCARGPAINPQLGPEFCSLGTDVPGAVVPAGFCMRRFATVGAPRVMAFAPNGDLFVAAPSLGTPGGAPSGPGAIVVFSDDNGDGVGEMHVYAEGLPDVHGLSFGCDGLYYTTATNVYRLPYRTGERRAPGSAQLVGTFDMATTSRWTHGVAVSASGMVFTTQGTYSATTCPDTPRNGAIHILQSGTDRLRTISTGYRNPMYLRCHWADEACMVAELGDDGGPSFGARERMIMLRPAESTDYGFPCCVGTGQSTPANTGNAYDCARVPREEASFPLNDTPFGLDWERGLWPEPYAGALFVALHGSFYSSPRWAGTRVVYAPTDPTTHAPSGPWRDFVTGFGEGGGPLERATDLVFANDGRLFVSDDQAGAIYWIAPRTLRRPQP